MRAKFSLIIGLALVASTIHAIIVNQAFGAGLLGFLGGINLTIFMAENTIYKKHLSVSTNRKEET